MKIASAGRTVELEHVLKHELSPVPPSSENIEGEMHSINKAELIIVLMKGIDTLTKLPKCDMKACLLIDSHALIQAVGKPHVCQTFGDYGTVFFSLNVTSF